MAPKPSPDCDIGTLINDIQPNAPVEIVLSRMERHCREGELAGGRT